MEDSMAELIRRLHDSCARLEASFYDGDKEKAKDSAREILSIGSKVHQRLGILVDIDREARWMAEVDRAVKAAKPELPGQLSIADAFPEKPKPRPRRKPKA